MIGAPFLMTPEASSRQRDVAALVAVALVAAAARAAIYLTSPSLPLVFDMAERPEPGGVSLRPRPAYPTAGGCPGWQWPAGVFAVAGEPSIAAVRLLNVVAGTAAASLTYLLARRAASVGAAIAAGLAMALYPSLWPIPSRSRPNRSSRYRCWPHCLRRPTIHPDPRATAGILAAVTTLIRPAGVAVLPAVLFAPLAQRQPGVTQGRRITGAALTLAGFILAMNRWWLHGARMHGRFVPLDTTSGLNVFIGNGPLATGRYEFQAVSRQLSEDLSGFNLFTPDGSNRATALAVAHVAANPGEVLAMLPRKLGNLLALEGNELAYLYATGHYGDRSGGTVWRWGLATLAAFPLVLSLGLAGVAIRDDKHRILRGPAVTFLGTAVALSLVTFGEPRFHLPFVPVLAVLATGLAGWRAGVHRWRAVAALALLLFLAVVWSAQLANYLHYLRLMSEPDGWRRQLSFDDLL